MKNTRLLFAVLGIATQVVPALTKPLGERSSERGLYFVGIPHHHEDPHNMLLHHLKHTAGEHGDGAVIHRVRNVNNRTKKQSERSHFAQVTMKHEAARRLEESAHFEYVEEDDLVKLPEDGMEAPVDDLIDWRYPEHPQPPQGDMTDFSSARRTDSWALDRIDQSSLFLDSMFQADYTGSNSRIYVLDTGVRGDHIDFGDRVEKGNNLVSWSHPDHDALTDDMTRGDVDCHGHGTHVASTAAGAEWGVAKDATVVPVRVFDCDGQSARSILISAVEWAVQDWQDNHPDDRAVISMSLISGYSAAFNDAVEAAVRAGAAVVVAAGNHNRNACMFSPAAEASVLTVGATDSRDFRASFSNWGYCVDIFAPGQSVRAADSRYATKHRSLSGTSMATPLVSGAVALAWEKNPGMTAEEVIAYVRRLSSADHLREICQGSENRFLQLPSERDPESADGFPEEVPLDEAPWAYSADGTELDGFYTGWLREFEIPKSKYDKDGYCLTFHAQGTEGDRSESGVRLALSSAKPFGGSLSKETTAGKCYWPHAEWYFLDAIQGAPVVVHKTSTEVATSESNFEFPVEGGDYWVRVMPSGRDRVLEFGTGRVEGENVLVEYEDTTRHPDTILRLAFSASVGNVVEYTNIMRCGEEYDGSLTNPDEDDEAENNVATFAPSAAPTAPTMSPTSAPTTDPAAYLAAKGVGAFTEFRKDWDSRIPGVMCFEFDSNASRDIHLLLAERKVRTRINSKANDQYVLKIGSSNGRRAEFLRKNRRKKRTSISRAVMKNGKKSHFKFEMDADGVIRVYMNGKIVLEQFDYLKLNVRYFSIAAGSREDVSVTGIRGCSDELNAKPANPVCENISYRTLCRRKTKTIGCKWGRKRVNGRRRWMCYDPSN